MKHFIFILTLAALIAAPLHARPQFKPTTPELRMQAAQDYLKDQPHHLAIYAKGFVCSSCGIGLRIHLKKLAGVDLQQFDKGVRMDASKQLLIVAFEPGTEVNFDAVRDAIYSAGYDPAHYYQWNGQSVDRIEFKQAN
jgi:hypothetical protein